MHRRKSQSYESPKISGLEDIALSDQAVVRTLTATVQLFCVLLKICGVPVYNDTLYVFIYCSLFIVCAHCSLS